MFVMMIVSLTSLFVIILVKLISSLLVEKVLLSREELSSYECGFEHHNVSRIPFSLRYFFLTLIFLLFDLEIIFIIFSPYMFISNYMFVYFLVVILFIFFLYFSLIYEWNDGTLEWLN